MQRPTPHNTSALLGNVLRCKTHTPSYATATGPPERKREGGTLHNTHAFLHDSREGPLPNTNALSALQRK